MSRKLIILVLLISLLTIVVYSTIISAQPSKYGASSYSITADRIRVEDGDKFSTVHSTTKDPITGLGQDNKWCAL